MSDETYTLTRADISVIYGWMLANPTRHGYYTDLGKIASHPDSVLTHGDGVLYYKSIVAIAFNDPDDLHMNRVGTTKYEYAYAVESFLIEQGHMPLVTKDS